ncbi:hypothetical protein L207DRAFT_389875, partial [Hyaloscypha variabilis F]
NNVRAILFSWLILARYVVFLGTFTSLKTLSNSSGKIIQDTIKNVNSLLLIAI